MKKQPFINFLREIMRHCPSNKRQDDRGRRNEEDIISMDKIIEILDPPSNRNYSRDFEFLSSHCKRKC